MVQQDPLLNLRLGKYRLVRRLGQGGMGIVYQGEDIQLQRAVAVKLLPGGATMDREATRRFLLEARAAARLSHPNVVAVHDMGQEAGHCYIIMELVRGQSGQKILSERGALPWAEATRVVADVCRGLAAAHAAGLVHRDIKPANILLGPNGVAKLTDFGLAKAPIPGATNLTQLGTVLGTPSYMSPEQCAGQPVDERTDLYALGATYYALLVGRPPYDGADEVMIMYAHSTAPVPDPRQAVAHLPGGCAQIVLKAMAKRRNERFRSAQEMLAALSALLATPGAAPLARVVSASTVTAAARATAETPRAAPQTRSAYTTPLSLGPARSAVRRLPIRPAGAGALVIAAVVALVLLLGGVFRSNPSGDQAAPTDGRHQSANLAAPVGGRAIRLTGRRTLGHHPGGAGAVAAGGRRLASVGADQTVRVWDLDHLDAAPKLLPDTMQLQVAAISADGKWLATGHNTTPRLHLWDIEAGRLLQSIDDVDDGVWALAFHPQSKLLAIGSGGKMFLLDLNDQGQPVKRRVLLKDKYVVSAIRFSVDGAQIAAAAYSGDAHIWNTANWTETTAVTLDEVEFRGVGFAGDGRILLVNSSKLFLWGMGKDRPAVLPAEKADINAMVVVPGGKQVVYGGTWGGPVNLYDLGSKTTKQFPTGVQGNVFGLALTPEGARLAAACGDGSVLLWDIVASDGAGTP
jgi:hypothetical protein